jgi:hypothetical protein
MRLLSAEQHRFSAGSASELAKETSPASSDSYILFEKSLILSFTCEYFPHILLSYVGNNHTFGWQTFLLLLFTSWRFIMNKLTKTSLALVAALALGSITASAFAREASEGPRGEGKGHPAIELVDQLMAREAGEGPRGEGKGHPAIDLKDQQVAREASEGPRGEGKGHPAIELVDQLMAREASEGPRGADRPGEDNGGRRNGRG